MTGPPEIRSCPRNCKRRAALALKATGKPGRREERLRPASQETGRRVVSTRSVGGTEEGEMIVTSPASDVSALRVSSRLLPALAALVFGIGLFIATGFAWPSAIHNATHDTRHALGLPCH